MVQPTFPGPRAKKVQGHVKIGAPCQYNSGDEWRCDLSTFVPNIHVHKIRGLIDEEFTG